MKDWKCAACGHTIVPREYVGRRDTCPECGAELRSCRQCSFRDPAAYNECSEPQAERVLDKDRANFCEYYAFRSGVQKVGGDRSHRPSAGTRAASDARADLEALFRKKS